MLDSAKLQGAATVLGTHGASATVDAALERVVQAAALERLASDTGRFEDLESALDDVRAPRA